MINFIQYCGPTYGLTTNKNHLVFRWLLSNTLILFSITRRGNGVVCHLYSDKRGLRYLKQAILEWCNYVFKNCDWCKMIIAIPELASIKRLLICCGFTKIITIKNRSIYIMEG